MFLAASPTSNYGWILRDDGANDSNTLKTFGTKNNATASNRPQLSVTFTVPWDSYENSERTVIRDIFSSSYTTAYMKATGFLAGNYNVSYYDGNGAITRSENNITVAGDGVLQSSILFSDYPSSTPGIWYVLVQPASGYFSLPSTYSTAVAAPDTYGLLANDSFEVSGTAIPEFPTVMAGIVVAGACFGIYWWMRRKAKIGMQTAN